jgi:hypothetical protein
MPARWLGKQYVRTEIAKKPRRKGARKAIGNV